MSHPIVRVSLKAQRGSLARWSSTSGAQRTPPVGRTRHETPTRTRYSRALLGEGGREGGGKGGREEGREGGRVGGPVIVSYAYT